MSTQRATPFHCPYCAEEDLLPREDAAAAWLCGACRRVFTVTFVGLSLAETTRSTAGTGR